MLTDNERERYQRHLQLPGFGEAGQQALKNARVCIVGMGGLGCPAALYLAAAGVGQLLLIDGDEVSLSNLQRQVLFCESDLGSNKALAARAQLSSRNSAVDIRAVERLLTVDCAAQLFADTDLVLDCSDNFHTRYLINDVCHDLHIPWIYASVLQMRGQLALFRPGQSCFRCLFPELGEAADCNQAGVLGAIPGLLGSLQALEAIKHLARPGSDDSNCLYNIDGLDTTLRPITLAQSPECPLCNGEQTYRDRLADYRATYSSTAAQRELPASEFTDFVQREQALLVDVRSAQEHCAGNLGGINIPLEDLAAATDRLRDWDGPILLYCQVGVRSRRAVAIVMEQGIGNALSLSGGVVGQD